MSVETDLKKSLAKTFNHSGLTNNTRNQFPAKAARFRATE